MSVSVGARNGFGLRALAVCAVSVCTGDCAAVRVTAVRVMRPPLVGDEGVSVVSVAEG